MENQNINQIMSWMYEGELNPLEAVKWADEEIRGITGTILRNDRLTLANHLERISIPTRGLSRKETKKLYEFGILSYWKAQQNGSLKPGELHIEKGLSSKHYAKALRKYIQKLLSKYNYN